MTTSRDQLQRLAIPAEKKLRRRSGPVIMVLIAGSVLFGATAVFLFTRHNDNKLIPGKSAGPTANVVPAPIVPLKSGDAVLTVSGYIIPRARIEVSPRFQGTVKWIGVKKGDHVKKGDLMVRLEDDEYRSQYDKASGQHALAAANLLNAETNLIRQLDLAKNNVQSQQVLDDARRTRDAADAELRIAKSQVLLAQIYLDWCIIRAPIDGTILEKLVEPDELVVPLSFGGTRGPSTALVSLADLNDLQVEIDVNEADLSKLHLKQHCRVSPEAYPEKKYTGFVAEIAPEANRSKGTLQVKVQIETPNEFLTPELTAKVEFLSD